MSLVAIQEDRPTIASLDTETHGVAFYDEPFCATLAWRSANGAMTTGYFSLEDDPEILDDLRKALDVVPALVMHNAKFDIQKLRLIDTDLASGWVIHDTEAIFHLLDEHQKKGLKDLAVNVLGYDDTIEVPYAGKRGKDGETRKVSKEKYELDQARRALGLKMSDGYGMIPRDILIPYALKDAEHTLRLFEKGWPALEGYPDDLMKCYRLETEVMYVLLDIEQAGVGLDMEYLETAASEYGQKVIRGEAGIRELAGDDVNPNSPEHLIKAFKRRGFKNVRSTDKEALAKMGEDDLAVALLEYRTNKKIHQTYLVALLQEQRDGIAHPWFRQHGTKTGRMASGGAAE